MQEGVVASPRVSLFRPKRSTVGIPEACNWRTQYTVRSVKKFLTHSIYVVSKRYHNPIDGCHFGYHEQGRFSYYTDAQEAHHQGKPRTLLESVALGIESVHDAVFGDPAKWDDPNEYWREHAEKQGHWLHSPDPLRQVTPSERGIIASFCCTSVFKRVFS